jgi:CheY-like chemotaxis protein
MAASAAAHIKATPDPLDALPAILLVEDETLVRLHVADHLRSRGFRVYEAANGAEALDIAMVKTVIDLVFSDVALPDMDGFALARRIRADRPAVPVVFASGHADIAAAAASFGPETHVFSKPYDLDELIVHFRSVIKARQPR